METLLEIWVSSPPLLHTDAGWADSYFIKVNVFVIIYSPMSHSKTVWLAFLCGTQKKKMLPEIFILCLHPDHLVQVESTRTRFGPDPGWQYVAVWVSQWGSGLFGLQMFFQISSFVFDRRKKERKSYIYFLGWAFQHFSKTVRKPKRSRLNRQC